MKRKSNVILGGYVMQRNKMRKFLSLLIVLSLVLSLGINTYALDDYPPDGDASPAMLVSAAEEVPLIISSIEVLNGGEVQILYRPEVYKGDAENGEDPDKYYTTRREINLQDPRIFNVEFVVPAEGITDADEFLSTVDFTYGGFPLSEWGNGKTLRGSTPILILRDKKIEAVTEGYKISASIRADSPWGAGSNASAANNRPYNGYISGSGGAYFGSGQGSDNRTFFQFGPTYEGPGTYALEAVAGEQTLASTDLHIGPYDGYHSWTEINEFCQDLIYAINGEKADVDDKPTGVLAAGTVVMNENGEFEEGDGVYVEVSILGYGLTDNYSEANQDFNNYAQFNPIWNVVVAKDADTVNDYLKPGGFKDKMNDNPQSLIDKYTFVDPEDIDFVIPFSQNNVHSDEISGTDSMNHLITEMIDGGKEGKTIHYNTFEEDPHDFRHR